MINKNLKTVALAASLVTLFAACDNNHKNNSGKSTAALAAQGEKRATADVLQDVIGQIDSSYSSSNTLVSSKIAAIGISTTRDQKDSSGAIGNASISGLLSVSIQLKGSDDVIALASLDDASTLQVGQVVDLTVSDDAAVIAALGKNPSVRAKCLTPGCGRIALLILTRGESSDNAAISQQRGEAGFIFEGQRLERGQSGVQDLNNVPDKTPVS